MCIELDGRAKETHSRLMHMNYERSDLIDE